MLLLIMIGLGVAAFVIYKRRQIKKPKEEEEEATRKRSLAEHLKEESYQEYMLSILGY